MSAALRSLRDPDSVDAVAEPSEPYSPREPIAGRRPRLEELECRALSVRLPNPRRDEAGREALRRRVLGEFEEMPGTVLSVAQASRLFGLPPDLCARILSDLAEVGLLHRDVNRCYRLPAGLMGREQG